MTVPIPPPSPRSGMSPSGMQATPSEAEESGRLPSWMRTITFEQDDAKEYVLRRFVAYEEGPEEQWL